MYVLMDLEWYEQGSKPLMLTQIAALTVDENWETGELFYRRIRPQYQDVSDWGHMAFSGGTQADFEAAPTLHTVLNQLSAWLQEGDVLCWWSKGGKEKIDFYLQYFSIQLPTKNYCILQDYITPITKQRGITTGNPYRIAKALRLQVLAQEHYSPDDNEVVCKLLQRLDFPQSELERPAKALAPKVQRQQQVDMPFQMDIDHNILHRRGCDHIPAGVQLTDHQTMNDYIYGLAKVCPYCIGASAKRERIERNKKIIKQSHYSFVYALKSPVFHRADCHHILGAAAIRGFGRYNKAMKAGLRPCKHCHPSINDQIPKLHMDMPQNFPPKKELRAIVRFNQSKMERKDARLDAMSEQERRDFLTLTNPGYGFWAAAGYGTFHSRNCRKLKGLTKIRGFARYEEVIRAGFTPCKCCKPTKKQDIVYSIPISNQTRVDESPADLEALCERAGYTHAQEEDIFELLTPVGRWRIHLKSMPVKMDHINLTMTPDLSYLFHRQHRIFLSLRDAFFYIKRHDDKLWHNGRRALGTG